MNACTPFLIQTTFQYDELYWSDYRDYSNPRGKTWFDEQETKLPTYWNTSFFKICLGMKIEQQLRFIVINKQTNSLYSLIATHHSSSLQLQCNREWFNAVCVSGASSARIGFVSNDANDCYACDLRIGFGTARYPDDMNACGYAAWWCGDNGDNFIKAGKAAMTSGVVLQIFSTQAFS